MATTTNYSWSTPDDTALVKDGAAAIRSLGTAIDSTVFTNAGAAINKTIVDAKGDLIVATAADTVSRLAVGGTNGHVLTVDSAQATGLKYAAITLDQNWSLLNAGGTALTGAATVTVSGISGKNAIMVLIDQASSATQGSIMRVRFNGDTGSNYLSYGFKILLSNAYNGANFNMNRQDDTGVRFATMNNIAGGLTSGYVLLQGCNSAGVKPFQSAGGGENTGGAGDNTQQLITSNGVYTGSSTISSVSVFSSTGNLDNGTVYVYATA
jgi:hypothetical protein